MSAEHGSGTKSPDFLEQINSLLEAGNVAEALELVTTAQTTIETHSAYQQYLDDQALAPDGGQPSYAKVHERMTELINEGDVEAAQRLAKEFSQRTSQIPPEERTYSGSTQHNPTPLQTNKIREALLTNNEPLS